MHVRRLITLVSAASVALIGAQSGPLLAQAGTQGSANKSLHQHQQSTKNTGITGTVTNKGADGADDAMNQANQYAAARTAPGLSIPAAAYAAAQAQAAKLPVASGSWTQVTTQPTDPEPAGYYDATWSNYGSGFGRVVAGRVTSLAADGSTVYAGAADGGVWKSTDNGATWTPIFDQMPTLSIGALAINPVDHSLWVGTGEANTNADSYAGQGVFRSADGGASFSQVGGSQLSGKTSYRLMFDGLGTVYIATSGGLYRRAAANTTAPWTEVLKPDPNPTNRPYRTSFITDVAVQPGSNGTVVLAALGWRGGTSAQDLTYNGFYLSTDSGLSFARITPTGAIDPADIGRTTFAYSSDGSKLYAIVESPAKLAAGKASVMQGVFVSANGAAGPWTLIADATKLCASGSGLSCPSTYEPGVQAWYNQDLIVDPANANHVIVGLEEEYQSFNGGGSFTTISPYWNYNFACDYTSPGPSCPLTTHPDQHGIAISGGTLYIGNDGGVYSRALADTAPRGGWTDLNTTLHVLQYYDAMASKPNQRNAATWGGLQDNGTTKLYSGASTNLTPAGGDGGYVIVDPHNGNHAVGEYVYLNTYLTTDGGANFRTITPSCFDAVHPNPIVNCDPNPRFIAPLATDVNDANHWVIGGEAVWNDTQAWNTVCQPATSSSPERCDWTNVHDTGGSITALAVNGNTTYAGYCGSCNAGSAFHSAIDTNYGGSWHTINAPNLPQRYIAGLTVDAANPAHIFAIYNGFSRRWSPSAGVGHVFESTDGGVTFTDISGNLPDVPSDALVYARGNLLLGTDIGAFFATGGQGAATGWSRLGTGLPNTSLNSLRLNPDNQTLLAGTHGRGIWSMPVPH